MECTEPELLGKTEILDILQQRHIKTKDMEKLSTVELRDIYRHFAVPLERRLIGKRTACKLDNLKNIDIVMVELNTKNDKTFVNGEVINQSKSKVEIQGKKRSVSDDVSNVHIYTDSFLISATKRIKIDWT